MKKFVLALVVLLGSQFLVPGAAQASPSSKSPSDSTNQTVAGLIVKYRHGVRPVDSYGQPTGDSELSRWDFKSTRALGFGYRSVKLENPLPLAEAKAAAKALEALPDVISATIDWVAKPADQLNTNNLSPATSQPSATWGLDRIDQTSLPLNGEYNYTYDGDGVTAYVIDSGINPKHKEFTGRILPGYSALPGVSSTADCEGHGTHVAGTIGGTTYGVAKKVKIVPVRIFGCNDTGGEYSEVIDAINWVIQNHVAGTPAVANMSIGGPADPSLNDAVTAMVDDGITVAVAAGNDSADACDYSPASAYGTITVNASDINDNDSWFSNFGPCTNIYAPGESITSAWIGSSKATSTIDGTSMATPHVAGAAARILSEFPNATPAVVWQKMSDQATAVDFIPSDPTDAKLLLHLDAPPSAVSNLTVSAGDTSVSLDWDAPSQNGGKTISKYVVQVFNSKSAQSPTSSIDVIGVSNTAKVVTGLTNGITYYFNVVAVNSVGTSAAVATKLSAVPAPDYAQSTTPTIIGTTTVGQILSVNVGAWSPTPKFTYQWLRNGVAIARGTKATYKLVSADLGNKISVRITATARGYQTKTLTSSETSNIN